jgi:hypothetical protein
MCLYFIQQSLILISYPSEASNIRILEVYILPFQEHNAIKIELLQKPKLSLTYPSVNQKKFHNTLCLCKVT